MGDGNGFPNGIARATDIRMNSDLHGNADWNTRIGGPLLLTVYDFNKVIKRKLSHLLAPSSWLLPYRGNQYNFVAMRMHSRAE